MRAALLVLLLSSVSYTQIPAQPDDPPTIRVSTQFVVLDALVEKKKTGNLISTLQPSDFALSEDGVPQPITYFSHDQLPLSIILLFDLTDTVRPALKPLAEGAREVLGHLKPQDEVAIMVFSSHTELLQSFTTDRSLAADAIAKASNMKSRDATFLHESMYEAIDEATKFTTPGSRRVMVWLTDGTSNFENSLTQKILAKQAPAHLHTKEETTQHLLRSGAVVSALIDQTPATEAFIIAADANPISLIFGGRLGEIKKYADLTGGPVLDTSNRKITARLAEMIDLLRGRYTLGYKPSTAKPAGAFCKLQLRLTPDARKTLPHQGDIVVRTERGYYR